jgi:hypothetical protein
MEDILPILGNHAGVASLYVFQEEQPNNHFHG